MYDDPHHCTFEHFFSFPLTVTGSPRQLPMYRCQLPRAVEPTARPFTFKVLLCFKLLNKCPHRSSSSLLARSRLTRVSLPVVSIFRTRDDLSTSGISYFFEVPCLPADVVHEWALPRVFQRFVNTVKRLVDR